MVRKLKKNRSNSFNPFLAVDRVAQKHPSYPKKLLFGNDIFLTVEQASAKTEYTPAQIRRLIEAKKLKAIKSAGQWLIHKKSFNDFLKDSKKETQDLKKRKHLNEDELTISEAATYLHILEDTLRKRIKFNAALPIYRKPNSRKIFLKWQDVKLYEQRLQLESRVNHVKK